MFSLSTPSWAAASGAGLCHGPHRDPPLLGRVLTVGVGAGYSRANRESWRPSPNSVICHRAFVAVHRSSVFVLIHLLLTCAGVVGETQSSSRPWPPDREPAPQNLGSRTPDTTLNSLGSQTPDCTLGLIPYPGLPDSQAPILSPRSDHPEPVAQTLPTPRPLHSPSVSGFLSKPAPQPKTTPRQLPSYHS